MTDFFWIRHAPVGGYDGILYGNADVDCHPDNEKALQWLVNTIGQADLLVTSGLKRTRQTALALRKQGLQTREQLARRDFDEQNFGDWQFRPYEEVPVPSADWVCQPWALPPNGESFMQVLARTASGIIALSQSYPDDKIVIVSHDGVIRAALAHAFDMSAAQALRFQIDFLSLTVIRVAIIHDILRCRVLATNRQA